MLFSVICFVDLGPDRSNLLAAALERVGITAVLRQPPAPGAVVLCRFSAAGLETLYTPADPHSLDLRSWVLAARAAATAAQKDSSPPVGAFHALAALDALLSASASWLSDMDDCVEGGGMVSCTLLCSTPASLVNQAALEAALEAADKRFWAVNFAVVAPTTPELDEREELRAAALASLADVVAASDNGGYRAVPCTPAAVEELAFALLIPKEQAVQVTVSFPAALSGGKYRVRLALRPAILPLRDGVDLVRLCNCHGRPLLTGAALVRDCPFVKIRGDYCCAISGKALKHAGDIHPNAIAIGYDVLQLPTFLSLPWLCRVAAEDGGTGAEFSALACVTLGTVSESQLFGAPFTAHAVEDEEEPSPTDASNAALVEALRASLHQRDCGLLLAGMTSLDTGAHAMFRCHYLAMPSVDPNGGLMLKRIASREEVLPASQAARAAEVPPALAAEVAQSLTAMLPDTPFDAWSHERGMHLLLTQAIDPSLAPPPRGATHFAEAEAMEVREHSSRGGRKSSKSKK